MCWRRAGIGSRGGRLIAPPVKQCRCPVSASSTIPKPVYSVPQSMPRTRMAVSVSRLDAGNQGKAPVFCEVSGSEDLREHQNLKPQRTRRTAAENAETQGNPEAELSATSSTSLTAHFVLPQKLCVRFRRRLQLAPPQKSRI